jgi:hypothetical protein
MELLVSCSDDEHQTTLKWDRGSHPVAPECRVSHTLRLKCIEGKFEKLLAVLQYIHEKTTRNTAGYSGYKILTKVVVS